MIEIVLAGLEQLKEKLEDEREKLKANGVSPWEILLISNRIYYTEKVMELFKQYFHKE